MVTVVLKRGRDKPVRQRNPWIFSGAIDTVDGFVERGCACAVHAATGERLGQGYLNPDSSIAVRMTAFGHGEFNDVVLAERIAAAKARRDGLLDRNTDSCRLVNSEGDFLPGLIVDRFGDGICIQILTAGMERLRPAIIDALVQHCGPQFIYERSEVEARKSEGIEPTDGLCYGTMPQPVYVTENGLRYEVNPAEGQKTGFYGDQRINRALVRAYAPGRNVCDCFCYTGGFLCNALAAGARKATAVDSSDAALGAARRNVALNGLDQGVCTFVTGDVFQFLRAFEPGFDLVILDPPKFAKRQGDVEKAARGYKDINRLAMCGLDPGGILFTFSCSQAVDRKLFRQIIFAAAADSGRDVQVLHTLSQPPDHPVNISHLEGEYLKGLVVRVL